MHIYTYVYAADTPVSSHAAFPPHAIRNEQVGQVYAQYSRLYVERRVAILPFYANDPEILNTGSLHPCRHAVCPPLPVPMNVAPPI